VDSAATENAALVEWRMAAPIFIMRKIILTSALVLIAVFAIAQDAPEQHQSSQRGGNLINRALDVDRTGVTSSVGSNNATRALLRLNADNDVKFSSSVAKIAGTAAPRAGTAEVIAARKLEASRCPRQLSGRMFLHASLITFSAAPLILP